MDKFKINLAKEPDEDGFMPSACAYMLDKNEGNAKRATVIIAPGGAYT